MKNLRFVPLLFILGLASFAAAADEASEEFIEHFSVFRNHFPRFDGSANEEAVFSYIEENLRQHRLSYSSQNFDNFTDGHSFSRNISVTVGGESDDTLLLVIPVNHPIGGDADGASWNLALGLTYLLHCKQRQDSGGLLPVDVTVLFAGGEFPPESSRQMGSELFLESYFPERNMAVLYFNIKEVPAEIAVRNGGNYFFAPYWIIDRFAESMENENVPLSLDLNETQLFRLGIASGESRINDYLRLEFPALEITTGTPGDFSARQSEQGQELVQSIISGLDRFIEGDGSTFPSDWDRHYLFVHLFSNNLLITEGFYIPLLLGIFSTILLFFLFFRRRMGKYRKILMRKFWVIVVLYALIFVFLFIGSYVILGISALRNFRVLWQQRPLLFFFLKLSAAISFFFFMFRFVKQFPFPIIRSFYSASAIFLIFTLMVVVSIFNISLSYYFVWAFIWSIIFSIFQNRAAKLICFIIAAFSLFYALYELFILQAEGALRFLILSPIYGNLFLSLVLLPFILMIIRISIAFQDTSRSELHIHAWALYSVPVAAMVALTVYGIIFTPFSEDNPRLIRIEETIDYELQERKLTAVSEAPLGDIGVEGGGYHSISAGMSEQVTLFSEQIPEIIEIHLKEDEFLDRKYYTLLLRTEGMPVGASMTVLSQNQLVIYDSNFPFSVSPSEMRGEIFIGAYPPDPLRIDIVVPKDIEAEGRISFTYLRPPYPLSFSAEHAEIEHRVVCTAWVDL